MKKWHDVDMNNSFNQGKYGKDMNIDLTKLYLGELKAVQEAVQCTSTFCENFETEWLTHGTFNLEFSDNFDSIWFIDNNYANELEEGFEINWFIDNDFINQSIEDFEDIDWDE